MFRASLGAGAIHQMRFDAASGLLAPNEPAQRVVRPGASIRHLVRHPNGHVLYAINEHDAASDVFTLEPAHGTLALVQTTVSLPRGFNITADGRWLIVAGQASGNVGVFSINTLIGELAAVGEHAVGRGPNWIETVRLA